MRKILGWIAILGIIAVLVVAIGAGCGTQTQQPGQTDSAATTINALVPCGQTGPFYETKLLFEKANPGVKIQESTENIAVITKKILDGKAAPDVFLSMGDLEVSKLDKKGLVVPGTRTQYVPNSLALIVSRENPAKVKTVKDLTNPAVKTFAMVAPETGSAGYHAQEAMEKLGIWKTVQQKSLYPDQPEMVAQAVGKGDAQAGIAYWPCMTEVHEPGAKPTLRKKVVVIQYVPQELYTPFHCEAAVIKGAKNPEMGKKFIEFLRTPEVQEIYTKWNFTAPKAEPAEGNSQ